MKTKLFNVKAGGPKSGNIKRISYYENTNVLEVQFKNNSIYHYEGVSNEVWEEAYNAPSIGNYLHRSIIGVYGVTKV